MTKEFLINVSSFLIFHLYNIILFVYSIFFKSNRPTRNFDPSLLGTTSISIADRLWNIKNSTLTVISLPDRAINFQREYEHQLYTMRKHRRSGLQILQEIYSFLVILIKYNKSIRMPFFIIYHLLHPE